MVNFVTLPTTSVLFGCFLLVLSIFSGTSKANRSEWECRQRDWDPTCNVTSRPPWPICSMQSDYARIRTIVDFILPEKNNSASVYANPFIAAVLTNDSYVNVTLISERAWYRNQLGFFIYDRQDPINRVKDPQILFNDLTMVGDIDNKGGCLQTGDTISLGPFPKGTIIGFFLKEHGFVQTAPFERATLYSISNDTVPPLNLETMRAPRAAWIYLPQFDLTVFSFEDKGNLTASDRDYNDVVFTFSAAIDTTNIPTPPPICYEPTIFQEKYGIHECYEWTVLESRQHQEACSVGVALPAGFKVAEDNEQSREALRQLGIQKWGSNDIRCVATKRNSGFGFYFPTNATTCSVTPLTAVTDGCHFVGCSDRFFLRSIQPLSTCPGGAGKFCSPTTKSGVLYASPSPKPSNFDIWPQVASVELKSPASDLAVSPVIVNIPQNASIDILIAVDSSTLPRNEINKIRNMLDPLATFLLTSSAFKNRNLRYGVYELNPKYERPVLRRALVTSTSNFAPAFASIESSVTSASSAIFNSVLIDQLSDLMLSRGVGWGSAVFRSVLVFTNSKFSSPNHAKLASAEASSGILPLFVTPNTESQAELTQIAGNLPLSAAISGDFNDMASRVASMVEISSQKVALVRSSDAGRGFVHSISPVVDISSRTFPFGPVDHSIAFKWDPTFVSTEVNIPVEMQFRVIGWWMTTGVAIYINRAPSTSLNSVTIQTLVDSPAAFNLPVSDADDNKLSVALSANLDSNRVELVASGNPNVMRNSADRRETLSFFVTPRIAGTHSFTLVADDGCESVSVQIRVIAEQVIVNLPPVSFDVFQDTEENRAVPVYLRWSDPDNESNQVTAQVSRIDPSSRGTFFTDFAFMRPVTAGTIIPSNGILWYNPPQGEVFSQPTPMGRLQYFATDSGGLQSRPSSVVVTVYPSPRHPAFIGSKNVTIPEDTRIDLFLRTLDTIRESDLESTEVLIQSSPTRGTFFKCSEAGDCDVLSTTEPSRFAAIQSAPTYPIVLTTTRGHVAFVPEQDTWGASYTTFEISYRNTENNLHTNVTFSINVSPINDPPRLYIDVSVDGFVIQEGETLPLKWRVDDIDSQPSQLQTLVRILPRTRNGWSFLSCSQADPNCTVASAPLLSSSSREERSILSPADQIIETSCGNGFSTGRPVENLSECLTNFFKLFKPSPDSFAFQYATVVLSAFDGINFSAPVSMPIGVIPVNDAPTVDAPPVVVFAPGAGSGLIKADENVVKVADIDASPSARELLTIKLIDGENGTVVFPSGAFGRCQQGNDLEWSCTDTISSFNKWLPELRFEFSSAVDRSVPIVSVLNFTINDLGNTGFENLPQLTATAIVRIENTVSNLIVPPENGPSITGAAIGAAAAGAVILAGLTYLLKRGLGTQADDSYFSESFRANAQSNPLYADPNMGGSNPMYQPAQV